MNKEFVPYDIALAMKELGFDELTLAAYVDEELEVGGIWKDSVKSKVIHKAPLYQQAFRWLREKYGYQHSIDIDMNLEDFFTIKHREKGLVYESKDTYSTYEKAELACLRKLIEIVNQNKNEL